MPGQSDVVPHPFWNGKRVLITGHTGFKGGWLSLWLQHRGAEVTGLALDPPSTPNLFTRARVDANMVSHHGDVRDVEIVVDVFEQVRPDIVFHMAAETLVRPSYEAPVSTYATNVMGTVHVLEAMRQTGSARVGVFITSDKCYQNDDSSLWGFRETDAMGGNDPYSSSKGCAELVISAYRTSYFAEDEGNGARTSIATVRAGNVIGGGDWATDRLVPDVIRAFSEGRAVHIRQPDAVRPWQHVLDPLSGYMRVAERLWTEGAKYAEAWNFGPNEDDARPVRSVVETMIEKWGPDAMLVIDDGPHPHEDSYLRLDCSKGRRLLDWAPRLPLEEALAWTVDWYRTERERDDMRSVTLGQIRSYEGLPKTTAHGAPMTSSALSR